MKNLAGNRDCDKIIVVELCRAGIEIVQGKRSNTEVPASVTGRLGGFTFHRAWYYWVVLGNMPLPIAEELYRDEVGKTDIRVEGHCGCPPPAEWVTWLDDDGKELIPLATKPEWDEQKLELPETHRFVDDPTKSGKPFITSYHIDTEIGLRILADAIKEHNLL